MPSHHLCFKKPADLTQDFAAANSSARHRVVSPQRCCVRDHGGGYQFDIQRGFPPGGKLHHQLIYRLLQGLKGFVIAAHQ
jgi:hypothetical protein